MKCRLMWPRASSAARAPLGRTPLPDPSIGKVNQRNLYTWLRRFAVHYPNRARRGISASQWVVAIAVSRSASALELVVRRSGRSRV